MTGLQRTFLLALLAASTFVAGCRTAPQAASPKIAVPAAHKASRTPLALKPAVYPPANVKRVAVTIDDGPSLKYVLKAMDCAEAHGSRVTFFVTGRWLVKDPQIARRISERGHEIGNHTWDHVALAKCPPAKVRDELSRVNALIAKSRGERPTVFRPPYGSHNATVDKVGRELGMQVVMWDIDPQDWARGPGQKTLDTIFSQLRPNSVILIHEVHNTYEVLDQLFSGLQKRGYTSVRVDELPRFAAQSRPTGR
ncbi:MAG: polysaccharide deacetylase family protein [Armatimonadota bacterium]